MEPFEISQYFGLVSSGGSVLSCQELTGLQAGLALLKSKERCQEIYPWGKIFGTSADYYIAYGLTRSETTFPSKCFYYAGEDFEFHPLPHLTEERADCILALGLTKPFTGLPDKVLDSGGAAAAEEEEQGEAQKALTEADRLAQAVREIDFDTAAVPKGAHALNEAGVVVSSSDFKGLSPSEAASITNYVHFRPPVSVASLRALARTDAEFYSNFLDPLSGDLPKGCWAVRLGASAELVTLRSLSWPGYVGFHVPGTPKFGGLYFGYAQKNRDLPFIL